MKISSDVVDMFYVAGGYIYGSTLPTNHLKIENNTVELSGNVTIGGVVIGGVHGYDLYYYDFGLEFFDTIPSLQKAPSPLRRINSKTTTQNKP